MGLLTSNLGEAGGFVRLNPASDAPELQYGLWAGLVHPPQDCHVQIGHGFTILAGLVGTKSAGEIQLQSAIPTDAPLIG
jgi:choline dehydrogenase